MEGSLGNCHQPANAQKRHPLVPDYHDRFIRDMDHFHDARLYIRRNPVKALPCREPEEWPLSSAGVNWNPDEKPAERGKAAD